MIPIIHRDARAERRESIRFALIILAVCLMIAAALWPDKPRKDPYTTIPESGTTKE